MKIYRVLVFFPDEQQARYYLERIISKMAKIKSSHGVCCTRNSVEIQCKGRNTIIYAERYDERKMFGGNYNKIITKPIIDDLMARKYAHERRFER